MGRTRIGLDIGATAVRAAELSMRHLPPSLRRVAQVPLPEGAVSNGEVRDPEAVAKALRELWRTGGFRSREVILGVANQRVVVREVSVPWLEEKELRSSLPFQVQEFVPISLEDAVLDYHVLEEFEREGRQMVRLLLVAAQKAMIQNMIDAVEAAKLTPVGLDLVPFAIVRSVGSIQQDMTEETIAADEALVDIGAEVTSICVHAWGVPRFVRILPAGVRDLATAAVPVQTGVGKVGGMGEQDEPTPAQVAISQDRVVSFVDDIRSSLEFYLSQMPGARIGSVLVSGGGSRLEEVMSQLEERVPGKVARGHAFHRIDVDVDLSDQQIHEAEPLLAVAVGLALPGVRG